MYNEAKKAYSDIFRLLKKKKDLVKIDIDQLEREAEVHLFGLELVEKYGFNIDPKSVRTLDWVDLGDYTRIAWYGPKYNRSISWEDFRSQPKDELLLQIRFSTGPYIFGDDYPVELFGKFFLELVALSPKYCDSRNNSLYFSMDNAGETFNKFPEILQKYVNINKRDRKNREIERLKKEL